MDNKEMKPEGFMQVYKDIADIIGPELTYEIFQQLRGQQVTFPIRLYTTEFVLDEIRKCGENVDFRKFSLEFGYTERYLRQLMNNKKEL